MSNLTKVKKVFISQPMGGHTLEEIMETRKKIVNTLETIFNNEKVEVVDNITINMDYITNNMSRPGLWYFAESLKLMIGIDFILFAEGWEESTGCRLEREIAKAFDIEILSMKELEWLKSLKQES